MAEAEVFSAFRKNLFTLEGDAVATHLAALATQFSMKVPELSDAYEIFSVNKYEDREMVLLCRAAVFQQCILVQSQQQGEQRERKPYCCRRGLDNAITPALVESFQDYLQQNTKNTRARCQDVGPMAFTRSWDE
jgi:hypothetical protein